jgi:methionyl-tRNA formyltransferase
MALRVAFFGLPMAALLLEHDGHELAYVGLSRTDTPGYRRIQKRFGRAAKIRPDVTSPEVLAAVRAARPDLLVSWFWTTRLPEELVGVAPLGGFGVHPSLLPRHRGPDPYFWAIDQGDTVTGVTAHRIAAAYDTGAILDQRTLAIDPRWSAWDLARALDRPSLALLRETVRRFAAGTPPTERPQDEALATEAPAPPEEWAEIVWDRPTDEILRRIRALSPAPGAFFGFGDQTITITRARIAQPHEIPSVLFPGEGYSGPAGSAIRTGDGGIVLLAAEDDDGPLDAATLASLFLFQGDALE